MKNLAQKVLGLNTHIKIYIKGSHTMSEEYISVLHIQVIPILGFFAHQDIKYGHKLFSISHVHLIRS